MHYPTSIHSLVAEHYTALYGVTNINDNVDFNYIYRIN